MTKGEKLIWELFLWLRELMPATPDNTRRQQEWAAAFHAMEHGGPDPSSSARPADEPDRAEAVETADHDADDDVAADPHEHGTPARPKIGRKKK